MKVIVDIGHPAHVHLYKNFIKKMEEHGHKIYITERKREITEELLKSYNIEYINIIGQEKNLGKKILNNIVRTKRLIKIFKEYKPDIVTGVADTPLVWASKFVKSKSIIFTDTEDAILTNRLAFPFTDFVCTPSCYNGWVPTSKHIKYNGYHELAYLHPNWFKPDSSVLDDLNLIKDDKFIIVRFSSWDASHDIGQKGFKSMEERINFIKTLEKYGKVFITSEIPLPNSLKKNRFTVSPEKIHSLLWYSTVYVGEGHTMATESAVLGTPSVIISSRIHFSGNYENLKKYGLIQPFTTFSDALPTIVKMLENKNIKNTWRKRREMLLNDKIDVTSFMVDFIERYPESFEEYKRGEYKWPQK